MASLGLKALAKPRKRRNRSLGVVTVLELEGSQLRVLLGEVQGDSWKLTSLAVGPLKLTPEEKTDPAAAGKAINKALLAMKVRASGPVVMGIPRGRVVLRTLTVPEAKDPSAVAGMVHFQIARDLPFRPDDAVIDFRIRGRTEAPARPADEAVEAGAESAGGARLEVLAGAVKREIVDYYQAAAEAAGLRLEALGLLAFANVRALEALRTASPDEILALVSVKDDEVGVDVIGQGTLIFSRNVLIKNIEDGEEPPHEPLVNALPTVDGSEPETRAPKRSLEELAAIEVFRTLHSYGGHGHPTVSRVVVAGGTGAEEKLVLLLRERLPVSCGLLDTQSLPPLPEESKGHVRGSLGGIGLLAGLADEDGLPFDFLHPKKPAPPRDTRKILALAAAAALLLVLLGAYGIRRTLSNRRLTEQKQLLGQLEAVEKQRPTFRKMIQQARVVDEWEKGGRSWLTQYAWLSSVLPPAEDLYVGSLSVSGSGVLRLSVQAQSGETLARMEKQLRAAGYDVKPVAITPGADRFGYNFRSGVDLVASPRMKIDLSKFPAPPRPADDGSLDPALRKGGGG